MNSTPLDQSEKRAQQLYGIRCNVLSSLFLPVYSRMTEIVGKQLRIRYVFLSAVAMRTCGKAEIIARGVVFFMLYISQRRLPNTHGKSFIRMLSLWSW